MSSDLTLLMEKHISTIIRNLEFSSKIPDFSLDGQAVCVQRQVDADDEGPAISLHFAETGRSSPLLIYSTPFGAIVGWDLRSPKDAWR